MPSAITRDHVLALAYYLLVGLVCALPLLEGATSNVDNFTIAAMAAGVGVLLLWHTLWDSDASHTQLLCARLKYPMIAYGLCVALGIAQCIPGLSFGASAALYAQASVALGRHVTSFISVAPQDSFFGLLKLFTYGAAFWLGLHAGAKEQRALRLLTIMICVGGAFGMDALYHYGLKAIEAGRANGGYIPPPVVVLGKNHFVVMMGMDFVIAAAVLWQRIESFRVASMHMNISEKVNDLLWRLLPLLVLLPILCIAMIVTTSRGGVASGFAGLLVLCLLFTSSRRSLLSWPVAFSLSMVLLFVWLLITGGQEVFHRYQNADLDMPVRVAIYQETLRALTDFSWLGSGMNSFDTAFKICRSENFIHAFGNFMEITHAHNAYLETLLTMGIPGFLCIMWGMMWVAWRCLVTAVRNKSHKAIPAIGVAIAVLMGLDSLVEFSMQVPPIALMVAFIFGLTYARAISTEKLS